MLAEFNLVIFSSDHQIAKQKYPATFFPLYSIFMLSILEPAAERVQLTTTEPLNVFYPVTSPSDTHT